MITSYKSKRPQGPGHISGEEKMQQRWRETGCAALAGEGGTLATQEALWISTARPRNLFLAAAAALAAAPQLFWLRGLLPQSQDRGVCVCVCVCVCGKSLFCWRKGSFKVSLPK